MKNSLKNIGFGLAALTAAYCGGCSVNSTNNNSPRLNPNSRQAHISAYVDSVFSGRYSSGDIIGISLKQLKEKGMYEQGLEVIFEKHDEVYNVVGSNFIIGADYEETGEKGQLNSKFRKYFVPTEVDSLKHGEHNH